MAQDVTSLAQLQERAAAQGLALAHFWAGWCEPCKQMDAVMAALATQHPGLVTMRVEAEAVDDASLHFNITNVPTIILLRGGKEVGRVEGADPPALTAAVTAQLATAPAPATANGTQAPTSTTQPVASSSTDVEGRIKYLLTTHPVCLFMKGSVDAPRCGFSRRVVQALQECNVTPHGVDILEDEALRQGLKQWANWPTYPQLYVKGEFVGGCDIVEEMKASGELAQLVSSFAGTQQPATASKPASSSAAKSAPPASNGTVSTLSKDELHTRLKALVSQQPVMLFMKGSPDEPRCGFSRKVVDALRANGLSFGSFDILSDESVRQGLKEFSNWPTYPQLYVKGELLGGCDIVLQLQEGQELKSSVESMLQGA